MRKLLSLVMAWLLLCTTAIAQNRTVSGKVTDEKGVGVPGVTVTAVGSDKKAATDANGNFTISVPNTVKKLRFSSVGFEDSDANITAANTASVKLKTEDKSLSEVVVVGYGTQRKKDLTGSIASVAGSKIKDIPTQSFDQALSGRMAGVNVTLPNGVLNNPPVIRVRGVNSISLSSFPLIVVDGVPTFSGNTGGTASNNPLGDINPADIESIDVLKDAAAAAIYGSRASAGVLLITTKKGKQGKARVNYDGWVGWTSAFNLIPMLDGREYETIKNEGLANAGTPATPGVRGFFPINDASGNPVSTNWYDFIYRTGLSQNHGVTVSGANDKTSYFFSAAYTKQQGMIIGNDFKRLNARLTLDHKVNDRLSIGGSFAYTNSINEAPNTGSLPGQAFSIAGFGRLPLVLAPNVAALNNDGTYNINAAANTIGQGNNLTALSFYNPKYLLDNNRFSSVNDRVIANAYAGFKIAKGLNFRSNFGIDNLIVTNKEFAAAAHGDGLQFNGNATNTLQTYKRWNWQNTLDYNTSFGNHNLGVLVGSEQQYTSNDGWGAARRGVADPFFNDYQGGFSTIVPSGNFLSSNYLTSFFGRINYDYKKTYLFSVNARRDGYSAFSEDNKYGNFWGASAGWVASNEKFFQNSGLNKVFSNFKLKASYGLVGNNNGIDDFAYWSSFNSGLYGTAATLFFSQAGNNNLRWETSKKTDIGVEFGILKGRVNVEATYFKNNIDNLILNAPQAPSVGIPGNSILANVGSMVNKGWELNINASVIQQKDFTWNSSFNVTFLQNEVLALAAGNADIRPFTSGLEQSNIVRVGESIGSFYAIRTGGVNPANGQRIFFYRDGTAVQYNHALTGAARWTNVATGMQAPRAADVVNDGVVLGPALPKWTGGWDNTFKYKNFDLNILLFFSGGNYVYNGTKAGLRDQRNWNNAKEVLTRWTKPGDITNIPRPVFGDNISNGGIVISENVEKGDFIKCRNLAIGYTLPKASCEKLGISSLRFYVQGQNLFTITKYTGFDPETSTNGNSNQAISVDRNSVPQARNINVGLNVGF